MFVEMACACEASLSIDAESEEPVWFLVFRFANQHVACGYMTAAQSNDDEPVRVFKKRIIKPRRDDEEEEL